MKIGLEVHQQLKTQKLFCSCPSQMEEGEGNVKIIRHLHPVLSELGKIDRAALAEFEKGKTFEYFAYHNSNCLVETDEEPPHAMNTQALAIALQISHQLGAKPVDEVHCMRKIVIDGSNTGGFQRTAIVAMNGVLETDQGRIFIPQIALEEESAGIVERKAGGDVYRLDRLGIPLVEISTAPEIRDGEHAREVAEKIGLLLRATSQVARGIGTIRQDLNISIEGGARVEIKGAQELKLLPLLVEHEVQRQKALLKIITEVKKREKSFVGEIQDVTSVFQNTESKLIAKGLQRGEKAFAMGVAHHTGLLGREINPNRRYATELSEYAKTAGVKGIIHSDEVLGTYDISESETEKIKQQLAVSTGDAFILVVASPGIAQKALEKVAQRLYMLFIPEETRKANPDGTSSYLRPLPGSARMYPETDVPPILFTTEFLKQIKRGESLEEKQKKLQKLLNPEMAGKILRSPHLPLFEKLVREGIEPMLVAATLENTMIALRREGILPTEEQVEEALHGYQEGKWAKAAIPEILRNPSKKNELQRISGEALEKIAKENNHDLGKIMAKYRLQVDAQELQAIIKRKK